MLGSLVGEPVVERDQPPLRAADDRADAFRRLVDRQLQGAYRLAGVILGDRVEAEDAVHDAAVAAWRAFGDLRDPARFEAWFRRILVNGCRDRLRARARFRVVDLGRELAETEHPATSDAAEATATRDALERALGELDPDHQVVVTLRFGADLTVPAIAATIGIPEGTVKSRLHHALGRLRAAMQEADR
jgi:RNA polymerase sigma-70 factor (ECF subfamily)